MTDGVDRRELRYGLLQARNPGDPAREDEWRSFAARLAVPLQCIRQIDVLAGTLDDVLLRDLDVLLVGGAGEYSVLDDDPAIHGLIEFLVRVTDGRVPVFASCFGFQALALGLGGEVVPDPERAEVGTYELWRTAAGAADPLFGELPERFLAQLGHKDRVARLPAGIEPLAASELCPIQAFRLAGLPVYATQFHPELDWQDNRRRFEGYMDTYGALFGMEEAQRKLDAHRPSPEANTLMGRFVDRFGPGGGEDAAGG